jgi:TatD DNase family protein
MPKFIDIGANLLDDMFRGIYRDKSFHAPDLVHVIQRARNAGCVSIFITAGSIHEAKLALHLAQQHGLKV